MPQTKDFSAGTCQTGLSDDTVQTESTCLCPKNRLGGESPVDKVPNLPSCDGQKLYSNNCKNSIDNLHPYSHRSISYSSVYQTCVILVSLFCVLTLSLPVSEAASPYPRRSSKTIQESALDFLSKYGYISGPSQELDSIRAPHDFEEAIKRFQRFARIPETGTVDHKTLALMAKPRCGNTDFVGRNDYSRRKKRFTLAPSKWPESKRRLTFRILNYSPDLTISETRMAIYNALYVWQKKTQLDFEEKISGTADIMIRFASRYHQDGYPFDGKGKVLAHAFFPGDDKGGDTHFDDDEHWTINSNEGIDLFMVAAHEFGHALGLAHSNVQGALMYPWYQGYQEKFELPYDDVLGIQTLYGARRTRPDDNFTPALPVIPTRSPDEASVSPPTGGPRSIDPEGAIPNPCTMSYDAIAVIRQEVYIFRQRWFWRLNADGIIRGSPVQIHQFWHDLPSTIDHIDALYEHPKTGKIIFFIGDKYWKFEANRLVNGFPKDGRPITEFGIPHDVKKIDAVFVWSYNKRTYLVSGDMYWKLDEKGVAEYDYPRDMRRWKGVRLPVNAAFQYWDEKTYFFQDQFYWEFNDMHFSVNHDDPKTSSTKFMRCENSQGNSAEPIYSSKVGNSIGSSANKIRCDLVFLNFITIIGLSLILSTR